MAPVLLIKLDAGAHIYRFGQPHAAFAVSVRVVLSDVIRFAGGIFGLRKAFGRRGNPYGQGAEAN
ncbi:MAG: hypothetical protein HQ503_06505 [Rhodospirillales bacterium]|nr:hypothetical protein [Rhodospirillales bacterium]